MTTNAKPVRARLFFAKAITATNDTHAYLPAVTGTAGPMVLGALLYTA